MGRRELNPVDAYRREQKKKEHKKHQYEKRKSRDASNKLNKPENIDSEIRRLQQLPDHNSKGVQMRLQQLQAMKFETEKNQKDMVSLASESQSVRRPEESVYYDPIFNPLGTPPPGYPPMFKSGSTHPHIYQQIPTTHSLEPYGYLYSGSGGRTTISQTSPSFPQPTREKSLPESIDPLDPAATGYNQRFGSEIHKRKRSDAPLTTEQKTEKDDMLVMASHHPTNVVDSTPSYAPCDPVAPVIDLAEIMKRRKIVVSDLSVGPSLPAPNAEENIITTPKTSILGISYSSDSESEECAEVQNPKKALPPPATEHVLTSRAVTHDQSQQLLPVASNTVASKPKQVRVESDLVSFVPAALRVKRKEQSKSHLHPSTMSNSSKPVGNLVQNSVDVAYEEFMLEINQLG